MLSEKYKENRKVFTAKECALLAVFVALVIATQVILSAIPGVELVTVLFACYAFACGWKRGILAATTFSLLRQIIFGFFPTVLLLYLIYYNLLTLAFGLLGKARNEKLKRLPSLVSVACLGTLLFTVIDCVITVLWYDYGKKAALAYVYASLPFMIPQIICTAVSVSCLFLPLWRIFKTFSSR